MPQNSDTNPVKPLPSNEPPHGFSLPKRDYGSASMLPKKPSLMASPMRSSTRPHPPNRSRFSSRLPPVINITSSIRQGLNDPPPPAGIAAAGSAKSEDHDPNLEHLQRINRPPAVISTVTMLPRNNPRRRGSRANQRGAHTEGKDDRGRSNGRIIPLLNSSREKGWFYAERTQVYGSGEPARGNQKLQHSAGSTPQQALHNGDEPLYEMEIDEIEDFSSNTPVSSRNSAAPTKAEGSSKVVHAIGKSPFPSWDTINRSTKYLVAPSDSSDQSPPAILTTPYKDPFVVRRATKSDQNPRLEFLPAPSTTASSSTMYDSSPDLPLLRPLHSKGDATSQSTKRAEGGKRPLELSGPSYISTVAKKRRGSFDRRPPGAPYNVERPLQPLPSAEMVWDEMNFGDVWRDHQQQTDNSHLQPKQTTDSQPRHIGSSEDTLESTSTFRDGYFISQLQQTANTSVISPSPFTGPSSASSRTNDSEVAVAPIHVANKEEPDPPRSVSPIDVDAPPLSLYEQLGLPSRTSGALRVPRPRFGKEEQAAKEKWSKEIAHSIRWVRGRESGFMPLIVGNIFWRSDGVSFDWKVPPEESMQHASKQDSTAVTENKARNDQQILEDNATAQATPLVMREAITTIAVKEEVVEAPLSSSIAEPANAVRAHSLNPPIHANEAAAPNIPESSQNTHATAVPAAAPSFPGPTPSLPTNRIFDSPDAMSNIATCFLDRYTRCFDHIKSRGKLVEAYADDAFMSIQFNDLPTQGSCPRVGQPRKQSHAIVNYTDRDFGRNLLLASDRDPQDRRYNWRTKTSLCIGPQAIVSRLTTFEVFSHTVSPSSSRAYQFVVTPLKELDLLLLEYSGDLYVTKADCDERYVSLRFQRVFVMKPNEPDASSWIDWPWVVTNDQMTLFHRPGIVCQCPP